jgi:hypothetical protein
MALPLGRVLAHDEGKKSPQVTCANGTVTVRSPEIRLGLLLRSVAAACGVALQGDDELNRTIGPVNFESVQVADVFQRLAGQYSSALGYHRGHLMTVQVFGDSQAATAVSSSGALRSGPSPAEAQQQDPTSGAEESATSGVIAIGSKLAKVFGRSEMPAKQLLEVAAGYDQKSVRWDAMRSVMHAVEHDPALFRELFGQYDGMSSEEIAESIAAIDPNIERVVRMAGRAVTDPDLRANARAVARQLRGLQTHTN